MELRSQRLLVQIFTPLLTVAAAACLTWALPGLRNSSSLFLFLAAVICTTRIAGWLPGLASTLLAATCSSYLFAGPNRGFNIHSSDEMIRLLAFLLIAVVILSLHASRAKSDMALRATQQRLMLCLDAAHMGVWDYNLLTRQFWWSKTLEVIYGRATGEFPTTYGRFFGFIHFDDQPVFNRAITRTIDEGTDYEVDHRIVMPDQSVRWVNTRGRVFFNQDSRAERIVGIVTDITAKKKIDRQQQLSREAADEERLTTVA